jgi:hypothetical protein
LSEVGKLGLGIEGGWTDFTAEVAEKRRGKRNGECGEFSFGIKNQSPVEVF